MVSNLEESPGYHVFLSLRELRKNEVQLRSLILSERKHVITACVWIVVKEAMIHFKSSVDCFGWKHASGPLKPFKCAWKASSALCSLGRRPLSSAALKKI